MSKNYEKEADELVSTLSKVGLQMREEGLQCAILCLEEKIKAIEILPAYKIYSKDLHAATEQVRGYKNQIEYLKSKL